MLGFGLRREVKALREELDELKEAALIRVYPPWDGRSPGLWGTPRHVKMQASEAIQAIARHVGLTFEYVPPCDKPAEAKVVPVDPATQGWPIITTEKRKKNRATERKSPQ